MDILLTIVFFLIYLVIVLYLQSVIGILFLPLAIIGATIYIKIRRDEIRKETNARIEREYEIERANARKEHAEYWKKQLPKCSKDPDLDIRTFQDPDKNESWNNSWDIHMERLVEFGRSKYFGKMYYLGKRGGIYTLSADGSRNYKY